MDCKKCRCKNCGSEKKIDSLTDELVGALMALESEDRKLFLRLILRMKGDSYREIDRTIIRIFGRL